MKLCKDCKYYYQGFWSFPGDEGYCKAPQNKKLDIVTGKTVPISKFASIHRLSDLSNYCGENAKWWEPK